MTILDLINASAVKGGLASDDADLKAFLSTQVTPATVVPEKIASAISGLMDINAAKNNPLLKAHFKQNTLEPLDAKLIDFAQSAGFEQDVLDALKAEKNTYNKTDILKDKLESLIDQKAKAKKSGDSDAVKAANEEISKLRDLIKTRDAEITKAKADAQAELERFKTQFALKNIQSSFQWSDQFSPDFRDVLFDTALTKELSKLSAKIVYKDGEATLVNKDNPDLEIYDSAQNKVSLSSLASKVMSENKFIKVAPTPETKIIAGRPVPTAPVNNTDKKPYSIAEQQALKLQAELGINP